MSRLKMALYLGADIQDAEMVVEVLQQAIMIAKQTGNARITLNSRGDHDVDVKIEYVGLENKMMMDED